MIADTIDQAERLKEIAVLRELQGLPPEIKIGYEGAAAAKSRKPKRKNTCNHWNVDMLYNRGAIDEDQHYAGVHIKYWRECVTATHLKALSIETVQRGIEINYDNLEVAKLDAQSLMSKIIIAMKAREMAEIKLLWAPCVWVAIDELPIEQAVAKLGVRAKDGRDHVKYSLTCLYEELERNGLLFWQRSGA